MCWCAVKKLLTHSLNIRSSVCLTLTCITAGTVWFRFFVSAFDHLNGRLTSSIWDKSFTTSATSAVIFSVRMLSAQADRRFWWAVSFDSSGSSWCFTFFFLQLLFNWSSSARRFKRVRAFRVVPFIAGRSLIYWPLQYLMIQWKLHIPLSRSFLSVLRVSATPQSQLLLFSTTALNTFCGLTRFA